MKKRTQLHFLIHISFMLTFALVSGSLFAQNADSLNHVNDSLTHITDSLAAHLHAIAPGSTVLGIPVPTLIISIFGIFLMILAVAQFILKRIPSEYSIKIQGVLGKLLNMLTFFQDDVIKSSSASPSK